MFEKLEAPKQQESVEKKKAGRGGSGQKEGVCGDTEGEGGGEREKGWRVKPLEE
jgi:hypothetical protein